MYLRKVRPRGRGSKQVYWELVESYRTAKGSRQRTVAYLGKLGRKEISGWQKLAGQVNGHTPPTPGLFDDIHCDESPGDHFELVDIKRVAVQRLRNFGDVYLGWTLWRMLGLDGLLSARMPAGREQVPWPTVATILCIARFCRPSSELHVEVRVTSTFSGYIQATSTFSAPTPTGDDGDESPNQRDALPKVCGADVRNDPEVPQSPRFGETFGSLSELARSLI